MKTKYIAAIAAIVLGTANASAADLSAPKPYAAAPTFNWTGLYAGVQGGYQLAQISGPFQNPTLTGSGPYSIAANGGIFGGFIGYNYQINSVVIGLEGDINASFGNKKTDRNVPFSGGGFYDISGQQTWNADIRERVGYAIDRFLPYISGGLAFGDVKTTYANAGLPPQLTTNTTRVGWTIGAGLEYAVTNNIAVRIDYRYTDLGTKSFTNTPLVVHDSVKFRSSEILAGISYKFN